VKIGIALAVYITNERHYQFAKETLDSISSEIGEVVTCGWMNAPLETEYQDPFTTRGHLHENSENNVSRAWNRGIDCLIKAGCDYVFVPNLDIVVQPGSLDRLVQAASRNPDPVLWTMANWHYRHADGVNPGIEDAPLHDNWVPYPHFSAFMVDHRLFEEVGPFDENFRPAYNEDLDMHWRIRRAGKEALQYEGARFFHHGSRTIGEDMDLRTRNETSHQNLNAYFVEKWGYKPPTANDPFTDGMFLYPFNDPARVGEERKFMQTW
jgi:GT2 family glycosyltransferase